jgi:hypothetical protein
MITVVMRGENFVAHLDGLGGTPVCRGTPVAYHCSRLIAKSDNKIKTWNIIKKGDGKNTFN